MRFALLLVAICLGYGNSPAVASVDHNVAFMLSEMLKDGGLTKDDYHAALVDDYWRRRQERIFDGAEVFDFPQVNTTSGHLIGQTNLHSHAFFSIPYAEAPVGDLRYMPPVPAIYRGELNVSRQDHTFCPELCIGPSCPTTYTEDCLVVTVFVPAAVDLRAPTAGQLLPVMFWIHGGGFFLGSGNEDDFDARLLSNVTNTIVVTVNYRLGPLGFLVYTDEGEAIEGNQGIKDQQLALRWVQDNIGKFGGDKNEVMIFGQSAGAQSVTLHFVAEESKPLFRRGITQSAPSVFYYQSVPEAMNLTRILLDSLERQPKACIRQTGIKCLRSADPQALLRGMLRVQVVAFTDRDIWSMVEPFRPVVDGQVLTGQPLDLFQLGRWHRGKDLIVGTTTQELAQVEVIFRNFNISERFFKMFNNLALGEHFGPIVAEEYIAHAAEMGAPMYDYTLAMSEELTDMFFICPSRLLTRFAAETKAGSVFLYANQHPGTDPECADNPNSFIPCGYATHSSDLVFVFRTGPAQGYNFTAGDYAVQDQLGDYWGSFAHTGTPSSSRFSEWPEYVMDADGNWPNLRIKAPESGIEKNFRSGMCDFWDSLDYYVTIRTNETTTTTKQVTSSFDDVTTITSSMTTTPSDDVTPHGGGGESWQKTGFLSPLLLLALGTWWRSLLFP